MNAWGGISSLQLRLPIMWTDARARGRTIKDLTEWLCRAPARQVGLHNLKGAIKDGFDADVVIWNPDREFKVEVEPPMLNHRHKLSPYNGEVLRGVVEKTFVRGRIVYDGGEFFGPLGQIIKRNG
jgi:allantoinase